MIATIATHAAAPAAIQRASRPTANAAAITAGIVNSVTVSRSSASTGMSASFALPGLGTPRPALEASSAPPAPSTSGPNHSSSVVAPAAITQAGSRLRSQKP
jgi:hypothetical protein